MKDKKMTTPAVKRAQQAALKKARINDLVSVKGGRGLIPWFNKILVLLQVDLSRSWSKVFGAYARRSYHLVQHIGRGNKRVSVVYLSLYLKTCSTLLQQAVGGQKLPATQRLGCAVARTGKGIPRIIPALHRRQIRMGNVIYIRMWLSLFGLYRILEWTGKLKTSTITSGSSATASWEQYADHLEPFFHKLAHLPGFSKKFLKSYVTKQKEVNDLLQSDPEGESNPFQDTGYWNRHLPTVAFRQIIKSSPLNLPMAGFTSSSLFSLIMGAKTWMREDNKDLFEALTEYWRALIDSMGPVMESVVSFKEVPYSKRVPVNTGVDTRLNPGYSRIKDLEQFIRDYPDINRARNEALLVQLRLEEAQAPRTPVVPEYKIIQGVHRVKVVTRKEVPRTLPGDWDMIGFIKEVSEIKLLLPAPTEILSDVGNSKVLVRPGLDPKDLVKRYQLGKLGTKIEPAGKVRVFALVDLYTQLILRPLHLMVQDLLRNIPQDGTFDQVSPGVALGKWMRENNQKWVASYDLSAATDRLPISLQQVLLQFVIGATLSENWGKLLVERDYWLQGKPLRYAVGQPMGALSSWVMLALTHHFVVQTAAARAGHVSWFKRYYVLGDDVFIADPEVAKRYLVIMDELGLAINQNKSLISNRGVMEFAKKLYRFDTELTPVSLKEVLTTGHSAPVLLEAARKYGLSLAGILKLAGYRHHTLGRVLGQFKRLPKRAHTLLICALSPTGPHAVPFLDWIKLTSAVSSCHTDIHENRVEVLKIQLWRDFLAIVERCNYLRLQEFDPSDPSSKRGPWQDEPKSLRPFVEFSEFLHNLGPADALKVWDIIEPLAIERRTRLFRLAKRVKTLLDAEFSRRFYEIDLNELGMLYELYQECRAELMFLIKTPFIQHRPAEKDEPFLAKYKVWAKYGALRPRSGRTSERERRLFLHQHKLEKKYGTIWNN